MTRELLTIMSNNPIAEQTYMMTLGGDTSAILASGQFINIKLDEHFLRRPMSIAKWEKDRLTIIYRVVGSGTKTLSTYNEGKILDTLVGLGNGFDVDKAKGKRIVLIGGSLGVAPLLGLAKILKDKGERFDVVIGFNEARLVFGYEDLKLYAEKVTITTLDGSSGIKGVVTDAIEEERYSYYFTCGSENMLRAVHKLNMEGQLSFEARMGCGFGACMGCSCRTLTGYKRICVEGPIMNSTDII